VTTPQLKELVTNIVTWVGVLGGLLYLLERLRNLIDWFRNRPRLGIRILRENQDHKGVPFVEFEATNLGVATVALEPTIDVAGLWVHGGEFAPWRGALTFFWNSPDRSLEPHKPRRFLAAGTTAGQHEFGFLWYRAYTFRATRGRPCRIYLRHIDGPQLSWLRFHWERVQLRLPWTRDALLKRVRLRLPDDA
jgi:hypothetical protein